MLKYMNEIPNEYKEVLNKDIMVKAYDRPLHEYVFEAFKGFEIIPNIKIIDYEYDEDESNYDPNDHIIRRNKNKNKVIKSMNETRCGVMYLNVEINGYDDNGEHKVIYLKKPLIIPIVDDKGYMTIKNKKCYLIYQLVDKMLYPSFGTVTIKSLMPVCVRINKNEFFDIDKNPYIIPTYSIQIFKTSINVLLIYSHLGINKTLNFLELDRFVKVNKKGDEPKGEEYIQFSAGKKGEIIISVLKDVFNQEIYVRSLIGCMIQLLNENKTLYEEIDDIDYWMIIVGGKNTIKRGRYQHIFFNRLLDEITKNEMKINDYDKQNIYYLLKYILGNFHALWSKDNLSMLNKRLRCNEYLSSLLTMEISRKINRVVSLGDRAKVSDFYKCFKFPEDIFLVKIISSGVLRYAEHNSDMDYEAKWRFTAKGPNSLGNRDSRRIPIRQRILHPSMIGCIDIADSSSSDPGRSGSLTPYNKLDSFYFDNSLYENEMHYRINKLLDKYPLGDDYEEIIFKCSNEEEYNSTLDALFKFSENKIKISGITKDPLDIIVENDPRENYRKFDESYLIEKENN